MRPFLTTIVFFLSFSLLTGCASGLRADAGVAPWILPNAADTVRVRILHTKSPTRLSSTGTLQFQAKAGGKIYAHQSNIKTRAVRSTIVFDHKSFRGDVVVMPGTPDDVLKINGRRFRGILVYHPLGSGRYDVIEYLGLQEYLYGVLPREVETSWGLEALKAQAVVSRTYALANKSQEAKAHFDLTDGVFDQVYGGMEVESPTSNRAVDETRGEIITDSTGKPVQAFFHSSCGGHTELPQEVWKSSISNAAFGSIPDSFCQGDPHFFWRVDISFATMRQKLRRSHINVGTIKKLVVVRKAESGRAAVVGLQTSSGMTEIPGNRFRLAMGADTLRSTLFTSIEQTKKSVSIKGQGWGHGVGLCQWGAQGRALAGQKYNEIVKAYFPNAVLRQTETVFK